MSHKITHICAGTFLYFVLGTLQNLVLLTLHKKRLMNEPVSSLMV